MAVRKIAAHSPEFWERFAPFGSATRLAERFPIESGGLSLAGWGNVVKKCRAKYKDLPWIIIPNGHKPPIWTDDEWPDPIYLDEVKSDGKDKPGPAPAMEAPAPTDDEVVERYQETVELLADGSCKSDKLLRMTMNESKDPRFLLEAHGFDVSEWELVSAKSNIYNAFSKHPLGGTPLDPDNPGGESHPAHVISTLYSSKITVKPKVAALCAEDFLMAIRQGIEAVEVERPKHGERLLECGFTDMHFGNSTLANYKATIAHSAEHIAARKWQRVLIWVGSDYFHCDNFKNTTSNGTPQSSVWWPKAVRDGLAFMGAIIELALANSLEVVVLYVPGNHDESMAWLFTLVLQERYPQVTFDTEIAERKVHVFGPCAIGMTHGDEKTRKDLDRVFGAEFTEFRSATFREVHMGHLHHETTVDRFGVVSRSLPTSARTDKWHRETGFVGANKVFQLFEWDTARGLIDIHYV